MGNLNRHKYVIGIDEAGRGPLAGPLAVGAVLWSVGDKKISKVFKGIKDSKKLSEKKRQEWFDVLKSEQKLKRIDFVSIFISEKIIDKKGLSYALKLGVSKVLSKLGVGGKDCLVLLDGALKAPDQFINQKTIIKGDEKEPIISLASIVAKVTRDNKMLILAKKYPLYNFDIHKGYGTKGHYMAINKHGICPIHRRLFLRNLDI